MKEAIVAWESNLFRLFCIPRVSRAIIILGEQRTTRTPIGIVGRQLSSQQGRTARRLGCGRVEDQGMNLDGAGTPRDVDIRGFRWLREVALLKSDSLRPHSERTGAHLTKLWIVKFRDRIPRLELTTTRFSSLCWRRDAIYFY